MAAYPAGAASASMSTNTGMFATLTAASYPLDRASALNAHGCGSNVVLSISHGASHQLG
jgi:hypothetical protein